MSETPKMSTSRRVPAPLRRRVGWIVSRVGPAAAWVGAVVLCGYILLESSKVDKVRGYAYARTAIVTAPMDGLVVDFTPRFLAQVNSREVIAVFDDSEIAAEIEVARAQAETLQEELAVERTRLEAESADLRESARQQERRLAVDVAAAELEALDRRVDLETTRIELARQRVEQSRLEQLTDLGFEERLNLDSIQALIEQLEASIAGQERALEAAVEQLDEARARRSEGSTESVLEEQEEALVRSFERRADVLGAEVALAESRLARCVARAPIDGIVSAVHVGPGEATVLGQPMVEITPRDSNEVVAYLAESEPRLPEEGEQVRVRTNTGRTISGAVIASGPGPLLKPLRLLRRADAPEMGIPLAIRLEDGATLPANTVVEVLIER